ncbi:MAG: DUF4412 domain-containing protein [Flavobacteriales bacterium]|nr:DUF4412 domain-containing protein [Flavobacteriales bacterium]MCB9165748.1 DUF4412 domain-containing protein [Flavobacteriales bacterium]HPF90981.1 DUF4412 domain-containing protein [Flavobacteriales bacterium]
MRKHILPLAAGALLLATTTTAQVDMNAILQQSGSNMRMEPDTDPFVPNAFVGSFTMDMHFFENGKESKNSPMISTIHSSESKLAFDSKSPEMKESVRMIIDQKEKMQYMLMDDGKGNKMAMKTRKMKVTGMEESNRNAADIQVTDETKTIDGHVCKKMIAKDEDGTWTGWMAQDIEMPFHSVMRDMRGKGAEMHDDALAGVHGFPLEYEWVSNDGKERVTCRIRDLKLGTVDEGAFSMKGYQLMEMPMMPPGMGR